MSRIGGEILFKIADALGGDLKSGDATVHIDDGTVTIDIDKLDRLIRAAPPSLNALRDACHGNAVQKGFHDPEVRPSVGESIALMHSELSEALEDHRKGHAPNDVWHQDTGRTNENAPAKPCGIPSEMADVIIRVLDFCGLHNIDIDRAVREKMAYNATRERMHGKRM